MSKLSDKALKQVERDGIDTWLGKTHREVAQKIEDKDFAPPADLVARYATGDIKLRAGRPRGTANEEQRSKLKRATAAYWDESEKLRLEGRFHGNSRSLIETIASQFNLNADTLENHIRRNGKTHK